MGLFDNLRISKLKDSLKLTKEKFVNKITETLTGKAQIDDSILDEIEEILISGDLGFDVANIVIQNTRRRILENGNRSKEIFVQYLKEELLQILNKNSNKTLDIDKIREAKPFVFLVVGVNGSGKTTSIGKLANNFRNLGLSVIVGAADTFRAAANEQLEIWAKRAGVEIISSKFGDDPSSIAYNTLTTAINKTIDVVIIDTAGRLHTKLNLMEELSKIHRVINKKLNSAPHEVLLVLDGNTGQNALIQAKEFAKFTELTGLIITKLDGTAKGGMLFRISEELNIPVRFIGVGEGINDLQEFSSNAYINALFNQE